MSATMNTAPIAPTINNEYLANLLVRQIELLEEQNRLLRKENSEWLSGDEAAEMLGKVPNASGRHLDVLRYLRNHPKKYLSTFGQLRPYTYLREEVQEVLRLVKAGRLVLP
ncbi:hypothetical protein [Lewinella sp. W8]|jgi:flagellar biosynthesis/type III secretory pathway ATPase|uniref:hypothetical protein n=1 Tax=Lewinella sp. W8 TaxID=2528208 RepID=UPI0010686B11|nr:hypothetical protein [Lewinella sp. W8]MTB51221.1 hypothetical protein [Lewinella sp. W8]